MLKKRWKKFVEFGLRLSIYNNVCWQNFNLLLCRTGMLFIFVWTRKLGGTWRKEILLGLKLKGGILFFSWDLKPCSGLCTTLKRIDHIFVYTYYFLLWLEIVYPGDLHRRCQFRIQVRGNFPPTYPALYTMTSQSTKYTPISYFA